MAVERIMDRGYQACNAIRLRAARTIAPNAEPNANDGTGMYNRVRNYASVVTHGQGTGRTGARYLRHGSSAGDLSTTV